VSSTYLDNSNGVEIDVTLIANKTTTNLEKKTLACVDEELDIKNNCTSILYQACSF